MDRRVKCSAIAMLIAPLMSASLLAANAEQQQQDQRRGEQQQDQQRAERRAQQRQDQQRAQQQQAQRQQDQPRAQQQGQRQARAPDLRNWDAQALYQNAWSAEDMLGTTVRSVNGEQIGEVQDIIVSADGDISRIVVEVGGFLEIGDQHIGVPWKDVRIGPNMQWVQVPLREYWDGTYALYGRVPQGEDVVAAPTSWRVRELIGDYASLEDVARYGRVTDIIFDQQGRAQMVVINRTTGVWGDAGWYGYPYVGYYPDAYAYPLPYTTAEARAVRPFDYGRFADQSRYVSDERARMQQQRTQARATGAQRATGQRAAAGTQRAAGAGAPIRYENAWSAGDMLDTTVRGPNGEQIGEVKDIIVDRDGRISRVVVEVGGFLEMGDQHIGVPWNDVRVGPEMEWVQVPLREVEDGTYSLYGVVPEGEDVRTPLGYWRVNELIGDYANLQDARFYGRVIDVIFGSDGVAQAVIVDRATGAWGAGGWYGYPYAGYDPGAYAYALPYTTADIRDIQPFDYGELGRRSPYASLERGRVQERRMQARQAQERTAMGTARQGDGAPEGTAKQPSAGGNSATQQGGDGTARQQNGGSSARQRGTGNRTDDGSPQGAGRGSGSMKGAKAGQTGQQNVLQIVENWKATPRHAALQMIDKYGMPDEMTPSRLIWFDNGPWKRTVVYNHEIDHDFPVPHKDALEQVISYQVPPDKFTDLARFDGSVSVDRTRGELIASCDSEPANFVAINLAHDIITGKRSVDEARQYYPKAILAYLQKDQQSPYARQLTFSPPRTAGFTDQPVVSQQMIEKVHNLKQAMMKQDRRMGGIIDQPGGKVNEAPAAGGTPQSGQGQASQGQAAQGEPKQDMAR